MNFVTRSLFVTLIAAVVIFGLTPGTSFSKTELGLHEAAQEGDLVTLQKRIEKGADVNGRDKDGLTPLMLSVGQIEAMKLLISKGADVNAKMETGPLQGCTVLIGAVMGEQTEAVKILIASGADINAKITVGMLQGYTALIAAVMGDKGEVAKILIEKGADRTNLERDVAELKAKLEKKEGFSEYRLRGELAKLQADLRNAYTATQAHLLDYPNSVINTVAQLADCDWKPTEGIVFFVRADMTATSGSIVLKSKYLNEANSIAVKGLRPGEGMVDFEGKLYVPSLK